MSDRQYAKYLRSEALKRDDEDLMRADKEEREREIALTT
jgi:hypothetical protein